MASKRKKRPTFKSAYDEYLPLEILGEGGSGRVYRAQSSARVEVAVKVLNPNNITSDRRRRFKNETLFSMKNSHKNIITVSDYGIADIAGTECPFYVMPFYSGTLRTLMKEGINHQTALKYFSQILDGIEAAHLKRVWHRDLKPENILLDRNSDSLIVADFGIARFVKEDLLTAVETKPGIRLANFQYASPEQRVRNGVVDHRSDIFALGLILNELFTGEVIFGTSYRTIGSRAHNYSYLDPLVEMMIRQSPEDRIQSIDAVKITLIGKKNEFVTQQRIDSLKNEVIPITEVVDPLVVDPVRITAVDFSNGTLIIRLNHKLNGVWVKLFRNMVGVTFDSHISPRSIDLQNDTAQIKLRIEREAQSTIDRFKTYLDKANKDYAEYAERKKRNDEAADRARIQEQIAREERRGRVLEGLTF